MATLNKILDFISKLVTCICYKQHLTNVNEITKEHSLRGRFESIFHDNLNKIQILTKSSTVAKRPDVAFPMTMLSVDGSRVVQQMNARIDAYAALLAS